MAPEPGMVEKVVRLHVALESAGIPHAVGGAIAVDYYRVPRATMQDWADIEAVCMLRGDKLDLSYMKHWLGVIIGDDDPRVQRLSRLVTAAP